MNVYEPEHKDVMKWVNSPESRWPAADWDYYVLNGNNDDLVLDLANRSSCSKQEFFIHCLYYLVGDYVNEGMASTVKRRRIQALLGCVDDEYSEEVLAWRARTQAALDGSERIDPMEWLHFGM